MIYFNLKGVLLESYKTFNEPFNVYQEYMTTHPVPYVLFGYIIAQLHKSSMDALKQKVSLKFKLRYEDIMTSFFGVLRVTFISILVFTYVVNLFTAKLYGHMFASANLRRDC